MFLVSIICYMGIFIAMLWLVNHATKIHDVHLYDEDDIFKDSNVVVVGQPNGHFVKYF